MQLENGKRNVITLHRFLLNENAELSIDHIDHNGLNNRRGNLRRATKSQNAQNMNGLCSRNKSGFRGVHYEKRRQKWVATIQLNNKIKFLGYYATPAEAGKVAAQARAKMMPYSEDARMEVTTK